MDLSANMPQNFNILAYLNAKLFTKNAWSALRFWAIALVIGILAGCATVGFRAAILWMENFIYGSDGTDFTTQVAQAPWYLILFVPVLGGLLVGYILNKYTPDGRVRSVAHVIEGAAIRDGRVEGRAGLASALASLITLSTGGSTGREGPVVHLGAVISSKVSRIIGADGITARDLMGCAVAAAVSASFNAPIAGALFAMEIVLRHFALHAFAPIVISSVAGAVVARASFGDFTEFSLPPQALNFYAELPAFLILGLVCGVVATCLMVSIFWAENAGDRIQSKLKIPNMFRPAIAGAMLGFIALSFPHIVGVGYETTTRALMGDLILRDVIIFAVIKAVAVTITMAGRMGGGIFSPALMMGALTGLAFGLIATNVFPQASSMQSLYALAGMGAVAAAVLGAPISTTLIVFELTGDWQTALAVMVAVSISSSISNHLWGRSFFLSQLENRGVFIALGPQDFLPRLIPVSDVMRKAGKKQTQRAWKRVEKQIYLRPDDTLEAALRMFETTGHKSLPVVVLTVQDAGPELVGILRQVDALKAFNQALTEASKEEHS